MKFILSFFIDWWIELTGTKRNLSQVPWLRGPYGKKAQIGNDFYKEYATEQGLGLNDSPTNGLLDDFTKALNKEDSAKLDPAIAHFYEHTAAYKLEVWSEWYHPVKWFAHVLIKWVSSDIEQLNIPLSPLETSRGMSNQVIALTDGSQKQMVACWLRKSIYTGKIVYAGFYSVIEIGDKPFIRVVFPLPKGSATVLLRVDVQTDGSVKLISDGKKSGGAGYYRVKYGKNDTVKFKYIPLKEQIHVFVDEFGVLRTDHEFWFWKLKFLHLHYKMELLPTKASVFSTTTAQA